MPLNGLVERELEVVHAGGPGVVGDQLPDHRAVRRAVEDAFQDHVIPVVERIADRLVDQPDVRLARTVVLPEQDPAQVVLLDPGHPAPDPPPYLLRRGALPRPGVPPDHRQPRRRIPESDTPRP